MLDYLPGQSYSPQVPLGRRRGLFVLTGLLATCTAVALLTTFLKGKVSIPTLSNDFNLKGFTCVPLEVFPGQTFTGINSTFSYTVVGQSFSYGGENMTNCVVSGPPSIQAFATPASWPRLTVDLQVTCNRNLQGSDATTRVSFKSAELQDHDSTSNDSNPIFQEVVDGLEILQKLNVTNCRSSNGSSVSGPYDGFTLSTTSASGPFLKLFTDSSSCSAGPISQFSPFDFTGLLSLVNSSVLADFQPGTAQNNSGLNPLPDLQYACLSTRKIWMPWYQVLWGALIGVWGCVSVTLQVLTYLASRGSPNPFHMLTPQEMERIIHRHRTAELEEQSSGKDEPA